MIDEATGKLIEWQLWALWQNSPAMFVQTVREDPRLKMFLEFAKHAVDMVELPIHDQRRAFLQCVEDERSAFIDQTYPEYMAELRDKAKTIFEAQLSAVEEALEQARRDGENEEIRTQLENLVKELRANAEAFIE